MICQIQELLSEECSYREISRRMGISRNTVVKYRSGEPKELSQCGIRQSKLDVYYEDIVKCLKNGLSKSKTLELIYELGYDGSRSNVFDYLTKVESKEHNNFKPQSYISNKTEAMDYKTGSRGKDADYITREGIFKHVWMNLEITDAHRRYIYNKYPSMYEVHNCIREFRCFFKRKSVPMLYLFIDKYRKSEVKALKSFAEGLYRDIDAIENAVAYDYSNGFVEGTNSRLKMIKRTMYGRCGKKLLEAKLRYMGNRQNG